MFPEEFKYTLKFPVFKNEDKTDFTNNYPIHFKHVLFCGGESLCIYYENSPKPVPSNQKLL